MFHTAGDFWDGCLLAAGINIILSLLPSLPSKTGNVVVSALCMQSFIHINSAAEKK